jgi:arylsulfatase A-like enzyme
MDRRNFIGNMAAAPLLMQGARKPFNIVYLHSHDTGRYIQPYGQAVPTPNLQKLASESILFRNAFSGAPTCSPSRAALLTGQPSHTSGMLGLAHRGFKLHDYNQHLLHTLRPAGYYSALCGVQHIARDPKTIGYDEVVPVKNNHCAFVAPAAVNFLKNSPKQPFYIEIGFQETHRPYIEPGPKEDVRYCQPPPTVPDTPETRLDIASFKATARLMDDAVGTILTQLAASGLADNTLVISTTDHGIAFPAMKCNLTDQGWGVMLMIRGPNGFGGGKVCDAMISQLDIYPTICELLNLERPSWLTGKSMMPVIRGDAKEINDQVFGEVTYHAAYEPKRAIRTHRYKYIRHFGDRRTPVLPNCDDGPSKSLWLSYDWKNQPVAEERLYDLVFDPPEHNNLATDRGLASILTDLRGRLDTWMKSTSDPLLKGPVPLPPGALTNDVNGVSPQDRPTA